MVERTQAPLRTRISIAALTEAVAAATPGPWIEVNADCVTSTDPATVAEDIARGAGEDTVRYYGGALVAESVRGRDRRFIVAAHESMPALLAVLDTARDLADLAAHVVCEPRRFLNNAGFEQQLLAEAVSRVRGTLANFEFDHQSNGVAVSTRPEKHDDPAD